MKVSVKHALVFIALFFGAYAEFQAQQTIGRHRVAKKKNEKHAPTTTVDTRMLR